MSLIICKQVHVKFSPKHILLKYQKKRVSNNVITDSYTYATKKCTIKTRE